MFIIFGAMKKYTFLILFFVIFSCKKSEILNENDSFVTDPPKNDINLMESLFKKFDGITTSNDISFFYVNSNGLPGHSMMKGITNWQQQIPINQEYSGDNNWAIPISPTFSETPLSTKSNLMKGALAIAVNGVPIFNPLNNRGEDANLIGELDQWGGHCGKADDYHYHIPPTHLTSEVGQNNPIAYALDGFPVYGKTTKSLDENLGILNDDGSYHYYTIDQYPYFIANMKGNVKTSGIPPENQINPQPSAKAIRQALQPINGATIVDFTEISSNSFRLKYTLNSEFYLIDYYWDSTGHYYLTFTDPNGTSRTETYHK